MATINVMNAPYSAVNNGIADDTAAINAALTAAGVAGGGTVYFPAGAGYRTTSSLLPPTNVTMQGDNAQGSVVRADFNGDTVFINAKIGVNIRDLGFQPLKVGGKTSGAEIRVDNSLTTTLENLVIGGGGRPNPWNQIALNGGANDYWHFMKNVVGVGAANDGLIIGEQGDAWVQGVQLVSCSFYAAEAGVRLKWCSGVSLHLVDTLGGNCGYVTDPGQGKRVTAVQFTDCVADSHQQHGYFFARGGGTDISQILMTNCWSASNHASGIVLGETVNGFQMSNTQVLGNHNHGVIVLEGARSLLFTGNTFKSNSVAAFNTYQGFVMLSGCSDVLLSGNQSGAYGPLGNSQAWGFVVPAGCTNVSMIGNQAIGNNSGGYSTVGLAVNVGNL